MLSAIPKAKAYLHIFIIASLYLIIRLPLINKPLRYDETYNTFLFLHSSPISKSNVQSIEGLREGSGWAKSWQTDWKRHLLLHPPLQYTFYYFWIRLFDDSERSLHILPLISGLAGVILFYFIGNLLFEQHIAFLSSLALSLSLSFMLYSTQTVYPIFEQFILLASLLCFCNLILTERNKLFSKLLILNLIGILIFYHYFVYLFIQTVILWFYRKRLKLTRYYFIVSSFMIILFSVSVLFAFLVRGHCMEHWMLPDIIRVTKVIASLPYYGITIDAVAAVEYFKMLLLLLFLFGCIRIIVTFKNSINASNLLKFIHVALFSFPFLLYLCFGGLGIRFGHARNFFYLLPIYFLIIFYGIEKIFHSKKIFYLFSVIIILFILFSAILPAYHDWNSIYLQREEMRVARVLDVDLIKFPDILISRPFLYYAKRYGFWDKIYPPYENIRQGQLKSMAIIENKDCNGLPPVDKNILARKRLSLDKIICHKGYFGPYQSLQRYLQPPSSIAISIYSSEKDQ